MTCPQCGNTFADGAQVCDHCGAVLSPPAASAAGPTAPPGAGPAAGPTAPPGAGPAPMTFADIASNPQVAQLTAQARSGMMDGWGVFKDLVTDPVGRLAPVARDLGERRALAVGVTYAVVFDVAFGLGLMLVVRGMFGGGMMGMIGQSMGLSSFGTVFKTLIFGALLAGAVVAASALVRRLVREPGMGLAGDVYVAGVSLLPFGAFALLAGILGLMVTELLAPLFILALCFNVLLLFKGMSDVAGIGERRAALAVPAMLTLAGWLSTVILRAMM